MRPYGQKITHTCSCCHSREYMCFKQKRGARSRGKLESKAATRLVLTSRLLKFASFQH